ncbi:MAG TPA: AraC family transcriptional regulator, partial [Bradyrhizobium sp.]|nr:AraC family transcriptional regulator [Bradyrhizobium sp.]
MSKPILRDPSQEDSPAAPEAGQGDVPIGELRSADVEMTRVLKTAPLRIASDPSGGRITHWIHEPLHDVVAPMADHVLMTFPTGVTQFERRTGKSVVTGTVRPGLVTVIPAGSSSRWDIHQPLNVVQLYLPHTTLERVAGEADMAAPGELLERTAHSDPVTSRLLMSAADVLEGNAALD